MKNLFHKSTRPATFARLVTFSAATILLASCASQVVAPGPAADVRTRLNVLQSNNELASRAPVEIKDAELAVTAAEQSKKDPVLTRHLVLIAGQKVDIAGSWAQSRLYEDQREALSAESDVARLESRTREADRARNDATNARNQTQIARNDASAARSATAVAQNQTAVARNDADSARVDTSIALGQAQVARNDAADARVDTGIAQDQAAVARNNAAAAQTDASNARAETDDLQQQLDAISALATERGQVVTLGDVMFETGKSELRGGTPDNLDKLAVFLKRYDTRTVRIEGYTDDVGTEGSNIALSQSRASSVRSYLEDQGVLSSRMTIAGLGEADPVASNDGDTGRQQNRRVEVIISN
ncbi:MAG: OmpA family protein [Pseudomonadota bacterium]